MLRLRSAVFLPLLFLWTAVFLPLMPLAAYKNDPATTRRMARIWGRGVLAVLRTIGGLDHREIGLENKPSTPALYVSNHQSAWETIAFSTLLPDVAVVLKEELYKIPVFGWFLRRSPMIAIDRAGGGSAMKKMYREARASVADGRSLLIFPEGTRRQPDEYGEFHRGVLLLYKAADLPVIPVAHNAGLFWIARSFKIWPGIITVSYLPAIPPGLPDDEFMSRVQNAIYAERDRLVAQARDVAKQDMARNAT